MGKYVRKCVKGIGGEVAVMEVSPVAGGARTRARAALAVAAASGRQDGAGMKRKADSADQFCISYLQLRSRRLVLTPGKTRRRAAAEEDSASGSRWASASGSVAAGNSRAEEGGREWDCGSRCSSNASSSEVLAAAAAERVRSGSGRPETEAVDDGSETTACSYDGDDVHSITRLRSVDRWRERTPSSEMRDPKPGSLESTATSTAEQSRAAASPEPTTPSEAEIEAFFAAAERQQHKRFSQKYNYDVVNDVPLQGRYEWVQIKP